MSRFSSLAARGSQTSSDLLTTISLQASHASLASQGKEVVELIELAAAAVM